MGPLCSKPAPNVSLEDTIHSDKMKALSTGNIPTPRTNEPNNHVFMTDHDSTDGDKNQSKKSTNIE